MIVKEHVVVDPDDIPYLLPKPVKKIKIRRCQTPFQSYMKRTLKAKPGQFLDRSIKNSTPHNELQSPLFIKHLYLQSH